MTHKILRRIDYNYTEVNKLHDKWIASIGTEKCLTKIVLNDVIQEAEVSCIMSCYIYFILSNNKFIHLSYEEYEFPKFIFAARAMASVEAQQMYPIDAKMSENKRKKQNNLQDDYISTHWFDFYDSVLNSHKEFEKRQKFPQQKYKNILRKFDIGFNRTRWILRFHWKKTDTTLTSFHYKIINYFPEIITLCDNKDYYAIESGYQKIVFDSFDAAITFKQHIIESMKNYILDDFSLIYETIIAKPYPGLYT